MTVFDEIIRHLERAKLSATLQNASFGFPNDRIEIMSVHFGDDYTGRVGDVIHPDEYIKNITKLHHRTWIIHPIDAAIELLRLHADTLRESENLINSLNNLDISGIIQRAKAGMGD
jgi:hypothetical protein